MLAEAPTKDKLYYSIEDIDGHLTHIVNVIKYSSRRNKRKCFDRADIWLDNRIMLMDLEGFDFDAINR